jgi:structural maintenance of chromosome 3 (chondroitin sulfate proteoglycan 6)
VEKEHDTLGKQLQEFRTTLEKTQSQQTDDNRAFSKQQKNDEKYHTKKILLTGRKDDVSRNIRDLGVLPEEAFGKYINEKLDRVFIFPDGARSNLMKLYIVGQETTKS